MLRNRRLVADYWSAHKKLISHFERVVATADARAFDSIIGALLESVAAFGATLKRRARRSRPLS
jgi:hypothetical protein